MTPDYDSADLDALEDLKRSRGYQLLVERVSAELERQRTICETGEDVSQAQGQCKAYRTMLTMREILKAEIQTSLHKEQHR